MTTNEQLITSYDNYVNNYGTVSKKQSEQIMAVFKHFKDNLQNVPNSDHPKYIPSIVIPINDKDVVVNIVKGMFHAFIVGYKQPIQSFDAFYPLDVLSVETISTIVDQLETLLSTKQTDSVDQNNLKLTEDMELDYNDYVDYYGQNQSDSENAIVKSIIATYYDNFTGLQRSSTRFKFVNVNLYITNNAEFLIKIGNTDIRMILAISDLSVQSVKAIADFMNAISFLES